MSIRFESSEGYPNAVLVREICGVDNPPYPPELFARQLQHQHRFFGCYAFDGHDLIGFKLGYEPRPRYFESFLGAVLPSRRRKGIATTLMEMQHSWCVEQQYHYVTTIAAASNNAMIILNLKAGFHITGTLLDRGNNHKVLLQKHLKPIDEDS